MANVLVQFKSAAMRQQARAKAMAAAGVKSADNMRAPILPAYRAGPGALAKPDANDHASSVPI